ncbi:transcription antitermination factor NusB [Lentilactobacillus kefiri]|uniref:Transcription antitermination protein NusB n=1 Tax=Lentilactobacillus kefiri TaxID=33962 RepID=A0A511DUV3_LENKE|nr:transcription antitermination factor NusB [Lentilactobacillus kefiri]KRL64742.1 NusB antitermination factor [Lentilactobacillus parakefiri DSM 10551]MCJ2162043.1 transcription antitermination factor NusB [Lentilactobacillus kefiri]MCP9369211.1 transcription antitermination factor NusB [Lentilactobacillus kefiri]MDH5108708.1 transcription antitermination factor NusB [Lentilactobacillus kefiri]MDM7493174.1 transcription antitermination factor NusB [Lentilactobacillus kefiri]
MELTRHQIREIAFQTLFALNTNDQTDWKDFFQVLTSGKYGDEYPEYLHQLISGVLEHKSEIDKTIEKYLASSWSLERIARTDLIILEIAIYEMVYVDDMPAKVSINEAIELAKKFSDDRSRKFVNGILSHALEELVK